jgi:hypothetical protein
MTLHLSLIGSKPPKRRQLALRHLGIKPRATRYPLGHKCIIQSAHAQWFDNTKIKTR